MKPLKSLIGSLFIGGVMLVSPFFAHATVWVPMDSNYSIGCGSMGISGNTISFVPEVCSSVDVSSSFLSTVNATTYYFTITTTGTGHIQFQESTGSSHTVYANPQTSTQFTITATGNGNYFQIGGGSTNWTSDMTGDLSDLCISDTGYVPVCPPLPPPPPMPTSTATSSFPLSTSTDPTYADFAVFGFTALFFLAFIPAGFFASLFKRKDY